MLSLYYLCNNKIENFKRLLFPKCLVRRKPGHQELHAGFESCFLWDQWILVDRLIDPPGVCRLGLTWPPNLGWPPLSPGMEVYLFKFVSKNNSNLPVTEKVVLSGIREGMGKGRLLQKVPIGPRSFILVFNLSLFINKLRGGEVMRSCIISNGGGRRGEEVQLEWDMMIDQS